MGFFEKNPNEALYRGGKKHWTEVIKNSGPGETLIWRQPEEDFNTNSTLIVMPGEEAFFVKGGVIEQVFENGTYKLSTENYPIISRLRNKATGGISTFNCVVYFVRRADSKEIKWGTDTPIQVRDKVWGVRTDARVRGTYKVRVVNPAKLLEKLLGNNIRYLAEGELREYFSGEFQSRIKGAVSRLLNSIEGELIGIDAYIDELSEQITPSIDEILDGYGLKCVNFSLAALDIDKSKYDDIDEAQVASIKKAKLAQGEKSSMDILGEGWGKLQAARIMNTMAQNPGSGGLGATGAGLGMGIAAGGAFGAMANQMFGAVATPTEASNQQTKEQTPAEDPLARLEKLKRMLDAGLIEKAEYDAKKAEILEKL